MSTNPKPGLVAALAARKRYAAERAAADPAKLDYARRVVLAALDAHQLSLDDLVAAAPPLTAEKRERLAALIATP